MSRWLTQRQNHTSGMRGSMSIHHGLPRVVLSPPLRVPQHLIGSAEFLQHHPPPRLRHPGLLIRRQQ